MHGFDKASHEINEFMHDFDKALVEIDEFTHEFDKDTHPFIEDSRSFWVVTGVF